jgi:hypothetical protein
MKVKNYKNLSIQDLPGEEWIDIIGYDGLYLVSNLGRIKSLERWVECGRGNGRLKKEKIMKQNLAVKSSSIMIGLSLNGKQKIHIVSRLVFFSFNFKNENLPDYFIMHKNNDWEDNRLENLKIGSLSEITKLSYLKGKIIYLKKGHIQYSQHTLQTAVFKNSTVIEKKVCTECHKMKKVAFFRVGYNKCKKCISKQGVLARRIKNDF